MNELVEKIKDIDLPEEHTHWRYTNYNGTEYKEAAMIQNKKQYKYAVKGEEHYLQIWLNTWFDRGPAGISHTENREIRFYRFNNEKWDVMTDEEFNAINDGLEWEHIKVADNK